MRQGVASARRERIPVVGEAGFDAEARCETKLARGKPGQLNYGSSGNGSSIHLTTELLAAAAKIEMTHVP